MNSKIVTSFIAGLIGLLVPTSTYAHVVVRPNQVGVGERVNFVVSVPTEEDSPTIGVKLIIPEELQSVRPNVKPGWRIQLVKTGEGESARISEIIWTAGSIPAEQRDEFIFSAQAPAQQTDMAWKAYQTYANGEVVAWDKDSKEVEEYTKNNPNAGNDDHDAPKPFSVTKVVNDLKATTSNSDTTNSTGSTEVNKSADNIALVLSILALILSGLSVYKFYSPKKR